MAEQLLSSRARTARIASTLKATEVAAQRGQVSAVLQPASQRMGSGLAPRPVLGKVLQALEKCAEATPAYKAPGLGAAGFGPDVGGRGKPPGIAQRGPGGRSRPADQASTDLLVTAGPEDAR